MDFAPSLRSVSVIRAMISLQRMSQMMMGIAPTVRVLHNGMSAYVNFVRMEPVMQ